MNSERDARNLVLTGFMGSGKSAVGRHIAAEHGMPFVDLDDQIAESAGCDIATIFAREGEEGFRRRERAAVRSVCAVGGRVIATGGGAVLDPDNLSDLSLGGLVVCLDASVDTLLRRIGADRSRPLLDAPNRRERMEALLAARAPAYARVACHVATDDHSTADIAREVWRRYVASACR